MQLNRLTPKKKSLRGASRQFQRLKSLKNFEDIHRRLAAGESVQDIARWICRDLGKNQDISQESLERQLFRYKKTIPVNEKIPRQVRRYEEYAQQYGSQVNTLKEITQLYHFQIFRLNSTIETHGVESPEVGKELVLAVQFLERVSHLKNMLGLFRYRVGLTVPEFESAKPQKSIYDQIREQWEAKMGPEGRRTLAQAGMHLQKFFETSIRNIPKIRTEDSTGEIRQEEAYRPTEEA